MIRKLLALNGLAIAAVVCNHAALWVNIAMFWWTDSYRPVAVPNYDQVGSFAYYFVGAARKLTLFCIPAFLLVSGFFVAYTAQASQASLTWKAVRGRIVSLLVPYAIWSVMIFARDYLQGVRYNPLEYLWQLLLGETYFYIPLLCQLYLFSPFLVRIARTRGRLLLLFSGLVQLGVIGLFYCKAYGAFVGMETPIVDRAIALLPSSSFVRWIVFFVFGILSGLHLPQLKRGLARFKWGLLVATVLFALLAVVEAEVVFRLTKLDWWRSSPFTLPSCLYTVSFVLCFLAFSQTIELPRHLDNIGRSSLGIYFTQYFFLEFIARAVHKSLPWLLAYQVAFLLILVILTVEGPLLLMGVVAKSPVRKYHRYVFG
jgi:fucose 4-O-acetylase-like acetyltransferase